MSGERQVSVSRVIDAPADEIFAVLANPDMHPVIDGSGTVRATRGSPRRLEPGSKFAMNMRIGLPYPISNTVVEFEQDRLIAWRHWHHHVWRYELTPLGEANDTLRTQVTETFDWSKARSPWVVERMGFPDRHPPAMERTLQRLDRLVTTGSPD